ncbi:uncharacterized protein FLJ37310-like [Vidua chalybeata]|uniref:uncharacterized protein FLJ37310-like n=1 Tax=Vidua chalybeata TaxID=81927 RepID=UPI0023A89029|nr:uncharacterized protein FLJ37310-like [Vidua chalybeata]
MPAPLRRGPAAPQPHSPSVPSSPRSAAGAARGRPSRGRPAGGAGESPTESGGGCAGAERERTGSGAGSGNGAGNERERSGSRAERVRSREREPGLARQPRRGWREAAEKCVQDEILPSSRNLVSMCVTCVFRVSPHLGLPDRILEEAQLHLIHHTAAAIRSI